MVGDPCNATPDCDGCYTLCLYDACYQQKEPGESCMHNAECRSGDCTVSTGVKGMCM